MAVLTFSLFSVHSVQNESGQVRRCLWSSLLCFSLFSFHFFLSISRVIISFRVMREVARGQTGKGPSASSAVSALLPLQKVAGNYRGSHKLQPAHQRVAGSTPPISGAKEGSTPIGVACRYRHKPDPHITYIKRLTVLKFTWQAQCMLSMIHSHSHRTHYSILHCFLWTCFTSCFYQHLLLYGYLKCLPSQKKFTVPIKKSSLHILFFKLYCPLNTKTCSV